ncbi:hypothetical protein [Hyalangium rubrum]|uniref:Uncharacterized protein n=1 Tax=Hyalangium rubrum TaxID=3103134 RepID=A0ABU5H600_9BACT|nr:hypothetical protein [Hyalangium sp. s54d21]MDY7228905.1 hypothetical protein [Hyalangium sp. s54d21]
MARGMWSSQGKVWVFLALAVLPFSARAISEEHFFKDLEVEGELSDGGVFTGKLTVTRLGYDELKGLTVDGFLEGKVRKANGRGLGNVKQSVKGIRASLKERASSTPTKKAVCDLVTFDIGTIQLGRLGQGLDLSPLQLDLSAVSGGSNLLGNMLCGVAGLLDPLGTRDDLLFLLEMVNETIG